MTTQCNETTLTFHELDSREVIGRFGGGGFAAFPKGVIHFKSLFFINCMLIRTRMPCAGRFWLAVTCVGFRLGQVKSELEDCKLRKL